MGTRSRIGRLNADGSITSIYSHWTGYPEHHLPILAENYSDPACLDALLALGDLSVLGPQLGEPHDFDDRVRRDWCIAYGRDRGDRSTAALASRNLIAFAASCSLCGADYAYLWDGKTWQHGQVEDLPVPHIVGISAGVADVGERHRICIAPAP